MKIKRERQRKIERYKTIDFVRKNDPSSGFTFGATDSGKPDFSHMTDGAEDNYQRCIEHPEEFDGPHIVNHSYSYYEPAVGICDKCGAEVEMNNDYQGAVQCPKCGQWYNLFGQQLKSPNKWDKDETYDDEDEGYGNY